ncbi:MAG: hypothetical protein H6Q70_1578 [Firmicutes bacterium]|nr:hypothetical protein [Bacillota bacterium]
MIRRFISQRLKIELTHYLESNGANERFTVNFNLLRKEIIRVLNLKAKNQPVKAAPKKYARNLWLITCLFGVIMLGAGCASRDGKEYQKTFSIEPGTVLQIYNKNGDIDVSSWDRDYVEVALKPNDWFTSFLKGFLKEPSIDVTEGNEFVIRTIYNTGLSKLIPVRYRISVPKEMLVTHVETSIGKINVDNVSGDVDAKTSIGEIQIHKVNGFVKAVTNNGNIDITEVGGLYEVRNDIGGISVEVPAIRENMEIRSQIGSVTVSLSSNIVAQLEASTSIGSIAYTDLPLTVSESAKTRLTGRLGEGSNRIKIENSVGSITLKKLL